MIQGSQSDLLVYEPHFQKSRNTFDNNPGCHIRIYLLPYERIQEKAELA